MTEEIKRRFNVLAKNYDRQKKKNAYYHSQLENFYQQVIPECSRVLEIGCATGDLLNMLKPSYGLGIDISETMIALAREKYPNLSFQVSDIDSLKTGNEFDYIVISHLLEYILDLYDFFNILNKKISLHSKVIITGINPLWEPIMKLATKLKLRTAVYMKNFVTCKDIENILNITGYEVIENGYRIFFPKKIPFVSYFLNRLVPRLPFFKNLCFAQYIIARPKQELKVDDKLKCSVIIPCFNEQDNLEKCIDSIPDMGDYTEILVVNDGSTDDTAKIANEIHNRKENVRLISYGSNRGKGYAVKAGFEAATGDILFILDADMTVLPGDLTKFYNVLALRQAEFVNGTRMVYEMTPGAMKFINYLGNKIFGIIISFIIGQRNTDTLCGTKAFYRKDYKNFKMGKCPWGDYDLLFEAARMKLKMVEMPVHYYPRQKGISKMKAFRHGFLLLRMCWHGFWYLD